MTLRGAHEAVALILDQPGPVLPPAARKRRVGTLFPFQPIQPALPILKPSTQVLTGANLSSSLRRRLDCCHPSPSIECRLSSQCPTEEWHYWTSAMAPAWPREGLDYRNMSRRGAGTTGGSNVTSWCALKVLLVMFGYCLQSFLSDCANSTFSGRMIATAVPRNMRVSKSFC